MNTEPLISVIVPVYGVEAYLNRCVESIVGQTYQNLQIILVDDGSPDKCPAMCDAWAEKDRRIRVIHKENGGLSDARNVGLEQAKGEYICFVDSDDWVDSRFVYTLYRTLISTGCDLAECGNWESSGEAPAPDDYEVKPEKFSKANAMIEHVMDRKFPAVVWNKLYKRKILTVPFPVGKYHEDLFWTYQIIEQCTSCASVPIRLYYHFVRNDSITGTEYSVKRVDCGEAFYHRCQYVTKYYPDLAPLEQSRFLGQCMWQTQRLLKHPEMDPQSANRKKLYLWARQISNDWKRSVSPKKRLWYSLYLAVPATVCKIRNLLRIGD